MKIPNCGTVTAVIQSFCVPKAYLGITSSVRDVPNEIKSQNNAILSSVPIPSNNKILSKFMATRLVEPLMVKVVLTEVITAYTAGENKRL